jgi:hypothetical protein
MGNPNIHNIAAHRRNMVNITTLGCITINILYNQNVGNWWRNLICPTKNYHSKILRPHLFHHKTFSGKMLLPLLGVWVGENFETKKHFQLTKENNANGA